MKNFLRNSYLIFLSAIVMPMGISAKAFMGGVTLNDQVFELPVSIVGSLQARNSSFKEGLQVGGGTNLDNTRVGYLQVTGSLDAKNQTRLTNAQVTGGVSLHDVVIDESFKVTGGVHLINSTVATLTVTGGLKVKNSTVNTITITAQDIVLDGSRVKNDIMIKVSKPSSFWSWWCFSWTKNKGVPEIQLHNSKIEGTIIFSDAPGIVHLYGDKNTIGKVENGTIVMHNEAEFPG